MTSPKEINFKTKGTNIQTIVDSLEYLSVEADKEGLDDVQDMFSHLILKIKNRPKNDDANITHEADNSADTLPQFIDLVNSLSSLDQQQLSTLKKIVSMV